MQHVPSPAKQNKALHEKQQAQRYYLEKLVGDEFQGTPEEDEGREVMRLDLGDQPGDEPIPEIIPELFAASVAADSSVVPAPEKEGSKG